VIGYHGVQVMQFGQFITHPMDLVCMHNDSLVSIKQQPCEHVRLCCPDMESLPIETCKCKPTDNILKSQSVGDESLCWILWVPSRCMFPLAT